MSTVSRTESTLDFINVSSNKLLELKDRVIFICLNVCYFDKMRLVILCGGMGTRLNNYSFPKPLNKINGRYAIEYVLDHIPKDIPIHFIYSSILCFYNFDTVIKSIFKNRTLSFFKLDYITRGPVESAYLGTKSIKEDDPIIFLDNDVINFYPSDFFQERDNSFIGCSIDSSGTSSFSFVKCSGENIVEIEEKVRISNIYCSGVYGFKSIHEFRMQALNLLSGIQKRELYMSDIYKKLIEDGSKIKCKMLIKPGWHIGSISEIENHISNLPCPTLRICFDLDNTLVTFPQISGDYSTVEPIPEMINRLNELYDAGHTIIIYTARRMATHSGNVGKVIKDIASVTINTLESFNIRYNELIFGKPIADIYIDDRAINPYINNMSAMGIFNNVNAEEHIINKLPTNKYNDVFLLKSGTIIKTGPLDVIEGEEFYYQNIPNISTFPKFLTSKRDDTHIRLELEYIKGIPYYNLYSQELLFEVHIDLIFDFIKTIHSTVSHVDKPSFLHVYNNYIIKLKNRFKIKDDYQFENATFIQNRIISDLEKYLTPDNVCITSVIHGDLWFSNMILDFSGNLKVFDMKGKCMDKLTLGGDIYYDYGKVYQSILGFDLALYNTEISQVYKNRLKTYFEKRALELGINLDFLKIVTVSLIAGTIHFISDVNAKNRVWKLVETQLNM